MPFQLSAAALNRLLSQNSWALPRLARFSGKTARFDIAPFSFAYTVQGDGTLRKVDAATSADAVCVIAPSLLPRLALRDEKAYADIHSEGDAVLLAEIFFLSRNLRWNAAENLGNITGDMAAKRIIKFAQDRRQELHSLAADISQMVKEYWTEEHPLLARQQQVAALMRQVDTLRDDTARLEQRINRLSGPGKG